MKLLPKFKNNPRGFTLVELLVVISIIAILSIIGLTLFSGVQKTARDAKRRADIDAVAKAMESHYNPLTGQYLALDPGWFSGGSVPQEVVSGNNCNTNLCKYCEVLTNTPGVCTSEYNINPGYPRAGTTFLICANLEIDNSGPGGTDFYCRRNQQ